ncbi:nucleotidyl transferase AbiEii/AbiGii toxin family protein [Treponema berlinense]|uniref:nucleotidyl transferase AbiEii/AbiGii toxin family protein n=1 Tax=Treponema berlinense TaxID=225004 RepID=UPI0034DFD0A5
MAFDDEGASLLINSKEQMFTEKLRSLLRFGPVSTRYKDIFDMYFLKDVVSASESISRIIAFFF